jgi:V/A-type H+/Na+-transporting ATPase subunit I
MLVSMAKVHILGHKSCLDQTLTALHELGVLHIENASQEPMAPLPAMALDADRLRQREEARFLLVRVDALLSVLPSIDAVGGAIPSLPASFEALTALLRSELDAAEPEIQQLGRELDGLLHEQQALPRYQSQLTRLLPLTPELTELEGYETVAMILDRRYSDVLRSFEATLAGLTQQKYVVVSTALDSDTTGAMAVFPRSISAEVHQLLGHEQVTPVNLPPELSGMSFQRALGHIERRLADIGPEIEAVRSRLQDAAGRWRSGWVMAAGKMRDRLAQLEAIGWLGETESTFLLVGWVPERAVSPLRDALRDRVGEAVILERVAPAEDELKQAPVLMENSPATRPFEFLIRLLSLPKYGTIDPTSLMAIFMPLFFGMMLGDIVYGALVIGLALWAGRRFRHTASVRDLSRILALGGAWAIVFGFVYGEALGTLGPAIGLTPLSKSR